MLSVRTRRETKSRRNLGSVLRYYMPSNGSRRLRSIDNHSSVTAALSLSYGKSATLDGKH